MNVPSKLLSRVALSAVEPLSLLIAEDSPMGCELLKESLKRSQVGVNKFVCTVTHGQIVQAATETRIDVALVSERLEDGRHNGLEIIDHLRKTSPSIRSILLAKTLSPELVLAAFRNGAKGIFCRSEPIQALSRCIRAVHHGQVWVNSEQLEIILRALIETRPTHLTTSHGVSVLTKREQEVASLVAEGLTNREIAKRLGLSEHTVGNYLFKCYEKLGLSTRVEFVLYILSQRRKSQGLSSVSSGVA
jgi:two-component system, NarL family, nitrate/nitrite response regulator NarL